MLAKVLGVLAGNDMPPHLLRKWAETADIVLAADSGADRLRKAGVVPQAVIGDMDSISSQSKGAAPTLVTDLGQETTDCDKLLAYAESQGFETITLASIEGDRLDHLLAAVNSAAKSTLRVRLALRQGIGWVLKAGMRVPAQTRPGRTVSLLPIEACRGVTLSGVHWPLSDADLAPAGMSSVSNRATSETVQASLTEGSALLILEAPQDEIPIW